jgi:signal transduction histidine kinase
VKPDGETINSLYEEIMLLKRLTDDLQELALAEAGQLALVFEPVSVKELIHTVVHAMQPQSSAVSAALSAEIADDLPVVEIDGERIQQVLRNLLDNAIRHTLPGGEIVISAEATVENILIRVQDSGEGLPPEALENVFERFYRVDPSRNRRTGGVGLGLAIVKQIVQAHDGRVWAENKPGGGTIFTVSLPLSQSKAR